MADKAEEKPNPGINMLLVLPTAMSLIGQWQDAFGFSSLAAEFCRKLLDTCRTGWNNLFSITGAGVSVDTVTSDLLTLWVTSSLAIWVLPFVTPPGDGRIQTTVNAFETLGIPRLAARALAFLFIALAIPVIVAPFGAFPELGASSDLIPTLQQSAIVGGGEGGFGAWLSADGVWLAGVFVALAIGLLCYDFFVLGPPLADARLNAAERRDLLLMAIALWLVSAALLVLAVMTPAGAMWAGLARQDLMVLSLLALVGLVAWRSALPLVQLASLAVVVFALDAIAQFATRLFAAAPGAG